MNPSSSAIWILAAMLVASGAGMAAAECESHGEPRRMQLAESSSSGPVGRAAEGVVEGAGATGTGVVRGAGAVGSGVVQGTGEVVQGVSEGPVGAGKGAVKGTVVVGKGVGKGAIEVGKGVGKGVGCIVTLGSAC